MAWLSTFTPERWRKNLGLFKKVVKYLEDVGKGRIPSPLFKILKAFIKVAKSIFRSKFPPKQHRTPSLKAKKTKLLGTFPQRKNGSFSYSFSLFTTLFCYFSTLSCLKKIVAFFLFFWCFVSLNTSRFNVKCLKNYFGITTW